MINGAFGILTNVILDIVLAKYIGIKGLTLATTSSIIVCTLLLITSLKKKIGITQTQETIKNTFKILSASLIMGVGVYFSNKYFMNMFSGFKGSVISVGISTLLGLIIYIVILEVVRVGEYIEMRDQFKSKFLKIK